MWLSRNIPLHNGPRNFASMFETEMGVKKERMQMNLVKVLLEVEASQ